LLGAHFPPQRDTFSLQLREQTVNTPAPFLHGNFCSGATFFSAQPLASPSSVAPLSLEKEATFLRAETSSPLLENGDLLFGESPFPPFRVREPTRKRWRLFFPRKCFSFHARLIEVDSTLPFFFLRKGMDAFFFCLAVPIL